MATCATVGATGDLVVSFFSLIKTINAIVSTTRNARNKLEAISRELSTLHVCLDVLEYDRESGTLLSGCVRTQMRSLNSWYRLGVNNDLLASLNPNEIEEAADRALAIEAKSEEFRRRWTMHKMNDIIGPGEKASELTSPDTCVKYHHSLKNSYAMVRRRFEVEDRTVSIDFKSIGKLLRGEPLR